MSDDKGIGEASVDGARLVRHRWVKASPEERAELMRLLARARWDKEKAKETEKKVEE